MIPTGLACPVVLKFTGRRLFAFAYGAVTRCGRPFQCRSTSKQFFDSFETLQSLRQDFLPPDRNDCSLSHGLGLGFSHFARHYFGNYLFSWRYLDVSVPSVPPVMPMYSACGNQAFPWLGSPIRIPPDQSLLTAPRRFSQSTTSFIGSWRQGIHRTPFVAYSTRDARLIEAFAFCSVFKVLPGALFRPA